MKRTKVSIKNILILLVIYFGVLSLGPLIGFGLVKGIGEKQAHCCQFNSASFIKTCQQELREFGSYQDRAIPKSSCEAYEKVNFCSNIDVITEDGMTCGGRYIFSYIFYGSIISFFAAPIVVFLLVMSSRRKKPHRF